MICEQINQSHGREREERERESEHDICFYMFQHIHRLVTPVPQGIQTRNLCRPRRRIPKSGQSLGAENGSKQRGTNGLFRNAENG